MNMQARVSNLKQQFEQLFPGKWLTANSERARNLLTGMESIDSSLTRGIARRRISEWVGPLSSGKSTLLRAAIRHWCQSGLNVAYIDAEGKLLAADWCDIGNTNGAGKFWIVRPPEEKPQAAAPAAPTAAQKNSGDTHIIPLISRKTLLVQEAIWSADQFIRSNAFDVVILDFGSANPADNRKQGLSYSSVPSRVYARLQRSLDKSRAALMVVRDVNVAVTTGGGSGRTNQQQQQQQFDGWGCHARFAFGIGTAIRCEAGLGGIALIQPSFKFQVFKDGMTQTREVMLECSTANRLFTHPQVRDRRTSKTRSRVQR
jgi:hypothetical protein